MNVLVCLFLIQPYGCHNTINGLLLRPAAVRTARQLGNLPAASAAVQTRRRLAALAGSSQNTTTVGQPRCPRSSRQICHNCLYAAAHQSTQLPGDLCIVVLSKKNTLLEENQPRCPLSSRQISAATRLTFSWCPKVHSRKSESWVCVLSAVTCLLLGLRPMS